MKTYSFLIHRFFLSGSVRMSNAASAVAVETPAKKRSKGKKALKVLLIILGVIAAIAVLTAAVNTFMRASQLKFAASFEPVEYSADRLVPEKDSDGYWTFTTDGDLRIVQLTDVHIGGGWMSYNKDRLAMGTVAALLQKEKPDLVIVTGDVSYPVPFQAGTFNNKTGALEFAELMNTLGCYWTIVYGNHDTEAYSYYSRDDLSELYLDGKYSTCIFEKGPDDIYGVGNSIILVKNTGNVITQALVCIDSNTYTDGDIFGIQWKYDNVHEDQIAWYKESIEVLTEKNKSLGADMPKSLVFMHIPTGEYKTAFNEFVENGYKDTEDVKYVDGFVGETKGLIYCPIHDDNLFETALELGSTQGFFCGHDHYNSLSLEYKGIRLSYDLSIDYLAYPCISKEGSQRGCTVITVSPDGSFDMERVNYYKSGIGDDADVTYQFDGVTYQYIPETK